MPSKGGGTFTNDEAKKAYNGLMIRNYLLQQAINAYARDYRIKNQSKIDEEIKTKKKQSKIKSSMKPGTMKPSSLMKTTFGSRKQTLENDNKEDFSKPKPYAFKYHVFSICSGQMYDQLNSINLKYKEYDFVNLLKNGNDLDNDFNLVMLDSQDNQISQIYAKQNTYKTIIEQNMNHKKKNENDPNTAEMT